MGKLLLFLFLLSILVFICEAADCSAGYSETIYVQVHDAKMRTIESACVNFTFQVDYTSSKGYFTTPCFYTNSTGHTSYLITNQEIDNEKVECNIVLDASYGPATTQKTIIAENHEKLVHLQIPAYDVWIQVLDQNNKPLEGAEVWIGELKKITDKQGTALFKLKSGQSIVYVKYGDGKAEQTISVTDDGLKIVALGLYPMELTVKDDNGKDLNAIAIISDKTYDIAGTLSLEKIVNAKPTVVVRYKNLEKTVDVDLSIKKDYTVLFDLTPPTITSVSQPEYTNSIKLTIVTSDPGPYSSGIATGGVELKYSINKSKNWINAQIYQQKKNVYIAEIPLQAPDTKIDFVVNAKDEEGNKGSVNGVLTVPPQQVIQPTINGSSGNGDASQIEPPKEPGFPWLAVVGILIVVAVIFLYFKYKGGDEAGG